MHSSGRRQQSSGQRTLSFRQRQCARRRVMQAGSTQQFDVAVIGAGAAGMMCAAQAGQRGLRVVLIDHASTVGEKIRISGGGRCNFTNVNAGPEHFISRNQHFCRSALARYRPGDFVALVRKHRIAFHEKHRGQLFCDESAQQIIAMLQAECAAGQVAWRTGCAVQGVRHENARYLLDTAQAGTISAARLVIATGGLSIPKIGATDFAYRLARQFGHKIIEPRPALVPLTFNGDDWQPFAALAGVASEVRIETTGNYGAAQFSEDLLFTHKGLSGPAILQVSSFWQSGAPLEIDLLPGLDVGTLLAAAKRQGGSARGNLVTALAQWLPRRLAQTLCEAMPGAASMLLADCPDRVLTQLGARINLWHLTPNGTEGFRKAEVTVGGVDTRELSSQTMESSKAPGLYFIGEAVDVTGWLGGYNFQWAWASAVACAQAMTAAPEKSVSPSA